MSFDERVRLNEEWEKHHLYENPNPVNVTHRRKNHPKVKAVLQADLCTTATKRLKAGPPTVKKIIDAGTAWTDTTFTGTDTLYWDVGTTANQKTTFDTKLADSSANGLVFARWPSIYASSKIFDASGSPTYTEPN